MANEITINKNPIKTVKDLMRATIKPDATFFNGGYDLFGEEIKKYVICKNGELMTWDDWYNKPHPLINKTEDVGFEVISQKQIDSTQ